MTDSHATPLTDPPVQTVPDKCNRILWRGRYYHLPIVIQLPRTLVVTDEIVGRFLGWQLPKAFSPDCGISFKRIYNEHSLSGPRYHEPIGNNLLTADQARDMLNYVLTGGPNSNPRASDYANQKTSPTVAWPIVQRTSE